ncbi:glutamate-cysteine ligase family protein [Streptomyces sp. NPDC048111]|uniref:carboxylate-amine ligase n=1 Tax=Streptomyces sp. NPDC048111 TaxID=3365500 RepID=UPI00371BA9FD
MRTSPRCPTTSPHPAHLVTINDSLVATKRIISSGTPVLGQHTPPPLTAGVRYAESLAAVGALDHEQTVCACHVHVGMSDLTTALRVGNHLRRWLPPLIAMSGNSPYWNAHDTGYDNWRALTWGRWPAAGPLPQFESAAYFESLVDDLVTSETLLDRGGLYWTSAPPTTSPPWRSASPTLLPPPPTPWSSLPPSKAWPSPP